MQLNNHTTEITVKLTLSGRYTWQIVSTFPDDQNEEGLKHIQEADRKLKDLFPNFAQKGSGRMASLEDE